jgi:hypothetical protein
VELSELLLRPFGGRSVGIVRSRTKGHEGKKITATIYWHVVPALDDNGDVTISGMNDLPRNPKYSEETWHIVTLSIIGPRDLSRDRTVAAAAENSD